MKIITLGKHRGITVANYTTNENNPQQKPPVGAMAEMRRTYVPRKYQLRKPSPLNISDRSWNDVKIKSKE